MKESRMAPSFFLPQAAMVPITLLAAIVCSLTAQLAEVRAQQPLAANVEYSESEHGALVTVVPGNLPELRCDVWCYEDQLGEPVAHEKDGKALILTHRAGDAKVTSRFVPLDDGVEIRVDVSGRDLEAVKAVGSLNPCCQFRHSDAFRNQGDYATELRGPMFRDAGARTQAS